MPHHDQALPIGARLADAALEATVVGSFSKLGPAVRGRLAGWREPTAAGGRVVVVTGATSGLGLAAATELGRLGARLCLVGRDPAKAAHARRRVEAAGATGVSTELADLGDLDQVADLADRLAERLPRIDVLVHNAGALLRERRTSPQGTEATVTVHLLAPYLLTERLLPVLESSAPSRVITVTSGGMYTQRFDLDDLVVPGDGYDGVVAYARAKRAQVVLTREWQRRYGPRGVDFHVVHPGWADTPGLAEGLPGFSRRLRPLLRNVTEGADTLVWLAGSPAGSPAGGRLWLDRRPRGAYRVPWTWATPQRETADGYSLWAWCHRQVGDRLPPA
jgi:NAD(P)-dependent dehydrogenase (short-subunit alcohol dehydrogenase family)